MRGRATLVASRMVIAATMLAGCSSTTMITFPVVTPDVPGEAGIPAWDEADDATKVFTARVDNITDPTALRASVRLSRHRQWVSPAEQLTLDATLAAPQAGDPPTTKRFRADVPHKEEFKNTQAIFFSWGLDGIQPDQTVVELVTSPVQSFRIGCPASATADTLTMIQTMVVGLYDNALFLPPELPFVASHGDRYFAGMGITFGLASIKDPAYRPALQQPTVLFYQDGPPPHRLLGWGYAWHFDPADHPRWHCVPWEAWTIHEAGWHPVDTGTFIPTPPADDAPLGSKAMDEQPLAPPGLVAGTLTPGFWHSRAWDIHMFPRISGVPALMITDPTVAPSQPSTTVVPAPPGWFFFPVLTDVRPRPEAEIVGTGTIVSPSPCAAGLTLKCPIPFCGWDSAGACRKLDQSACNLECLP